MPISAGYGLLRTQLVSCHSMKPASTVDVVTRLEVLAVASIVPMGLKPHYPSPIPLVPSGISPAMSMLKTAGSMGSTADVNKSAKLTATAVSVIAPLCPSFGKTTLETQLKSAWSMKNSATIDIVSTLEANAVITYYLAGGII